MTQSRSSLSTLLTLLQFGINVSFDLKKSLINGILKWNGFSHPSILIIMDLFYGFLTLLVNTIFKKSFFLAFKRSTPSPFSMIILNTSFTLLCTSSWKVHIISHFHLRFKVAISGVRSKPGFATYQLHNLGPVT